MLAMLLLYRNPRVCNVYYHAVLILVCVVGSLSFSHNQLHRTNNNGRHAFRHIMSSELFSEKIPSNSGKGGVQSGNRLMVFGLGNVGSLVAQRSTSFEYIDDNNSHARFFDDVYGTTRSGKDIAGVQAVDFDSQDQLKEILPSCTHILVTIPPVELPSDVDNDVNATLVGAENFCDPVLNHPNFSIKELLPSNAWVGYISSTSVYGNHDGEWVTEDSEVKCSPGTKGELYFRAENEWRNASKECGWRMHVFRSAGLYGDNRSAIHTIRKKGVIAPGPKRDGASKQKTSKKMFPTSRIHEEDVSRAVLSAMKYGEPIAGNDCLWNLADDEPAPRGEVMAFGKQLLEDTNLLPTELEKKSPSKIQPQSERERRRGTDRKRVGNQRLKELLLSDGKLLYPTYREGLQSVLNLNRKEWSSDTSSES